MADASGKCLCGAVRFAISYPTNWVAHCHCTMCQRAHGAAFVTWVSVPAGAFSVTEGQAALKWFHSSKQAERGFCTLCGSSLFFRSEKWPGEVHIARANFDGEVDREPRVHGFYDTHVSWFTVNDALPKKP
jgi:hypothetical protein